MLKESKGLGPWASDSADLEVARDLSKLFYMQVKGLRMTVLNQTRSIPFPHPFWAGRVGKKHTNNTSG